MVLGSMVIGILSGLASLFHHHERVINVGCAVGAPSSSSSANGSVDGTAVSSSSLVSTGAKSEFRLDCPIPHCASWKLIPVGDSVVMVAFFVSV